MPQAFASPPVAGPPTRARARLAGALVLSAVVHGTLLPGGGGSLSSRPSRAVQPPNPLTVSLETLGEEALARVGPDRPEPNEPAPERPRVRQRTPAADPARHPRHAAADPASPEVDAGLGADNALYGVRELDVFPRLLSQLDLGTATTDGIRVVIHIDAAGRVEAVELNDRDGGSGSHATLRERLLQAQFSPALKSGRAVRSRLLVEFAAAGR